jgi:hypothetical protein
MLDITIGLTNLDNYTTIASPSANGLNLYLMCRSCGNRGGILSLQHLSSCVIAGGPRLINYTFNPQNLVATISVPQLQRNLCQSRLNVYTNP